MNEQLLTLKKLREEDRQTGYIAIASGKGGVGKTLITLHTGKILANHGRKVLIVDGDLGLSNVHIMLGITPQKNLYHYFTGESPIEDVVVPIEENLSFISSGSGIRELVNLPEKQLLSLIERLKEFAEREHDWVIFDTPPGIHSDTLSIVSSVNIPIIVTTPEPTAIADAYGLIKVVNSSAKVEEFYLIVNKVSSKEEGEKVYESIQRVCEKFTKAQVVYLGSLTYNPRIIRHIVNQSPFNEGLIRELSTALSRLPTGVSPPRVSFWEKLLGRLTRR